MVDAQPWWAGAVIYQIYPRSFADADGDGLGDLAGIRARLDHLVWLGVDAVWLSPFYRSPMADAGYDVSDHCDVDPTFGTLADAEALIAEAHERGLRVLVDFVPNHTSDRHPWFEASRSSRDDPKRHWYVWRDPAPDGGPPNNWRAAFTGETRWERDDSGQLRPHWGLPLERTGTSTDPHASTGTDSQSDGDGAPHTDTRTSTDPHTDTGTNTDTDSQSDDEAGDGDASISAWTFDERTGQCYLHTFLPEQPDLDWRNPDVVAAQHDVLRFWLDRGVDGFRVDAIVTLGKPVGLPDAPPELARFPEAGLTDEDFTRAKVAELRAVVEAYDGDRVLLGEVGGVDASAIGRYVADDLFHLAFDFPPMVDRWDAERWRHHIDEALRHHGTASWPTWVLSNHDTPRHRERYGTEARARAAAVLLLALRGTAMLYAGEELGLADADVPDDQRLDPGRRDGCRAPIPWTAEDDHGWGEPTWLPFPANAEGHDVATERDDPASMLHLYRRLLAARRASPALRHGTFAWADAPAGVLAWHRRSPADADTAATTNTSDGPTAALGSASPARSAALDERLVVVSFVDEDRVVTPPGSGWVIEVSSHGDGSEAGRPWTGHLRPDEAVVLRPSSTPPEPDTPRTTSTRARHHPSPTPPGATSTRARHRRGRSPRGAERGGDDPTGRSAGAD